MTIDDVLFAVATFWQALRNQGKHFAFGGTDTFDQNVQQLVAGGIYPRVGVVGEGNRFIMPLFFPPDPKDTDEEYKGNLERKKKEKNATLEATNGKANAGAETPSSPLGHLLLAVAEKDSPNSKKLDIRIFDSRNITLHRNVIRRRATKLTRDWSEMNAEPHFDWRVVPQQIGESNACGLYVIFNAWAVMLGIEPNIKRSTQRGGYGTDREFLVQGLAIVNLALAGFMDSRTIMAFLNYYGYTEVVDLLDRGDEVENAVIAVRMDSTRFNLALRDSDLSSTSSSPDSARRTISTEVEEALVESMVPQFMENAPGATREEAKHYLTITEDIQEAVTAYMMDQSQAGGIAEAEPS